MSRNASFRPTRRAVFSLAAAALAAPAAMRFAWAQPAAPVRRSAHELTARDPVVVSLRRGIEVMRQRDALMPNNLPHPGGWRQGALYHAQICGPSARLTGLRDPENEVHGGWWFLPWHRAYLAAMELALREASGDPNLALPYWDVHSNPTIPPIYEGDPAANPLSHAMRRVGAFPGFSSPVPMTGAGRQTERHSVRAVSFVEFAGGRPVGGRFLPGQLEMEAHNSTHAFVGGDMFDFSTSGFDPLFYALHANVDRLWEVWRNLGGGRASPTDPIWGSRRFAFQNRNGGMLQVATQDLTVPSAISFLEFGLNGARTIRAPYAYDRVSFGGFGGTASAAPTGSGPREFQYVLAAEGATTIGPAARELRPPTRSGLSAPASANGGGNGNGSAAPPVPPPVTTSMTVDLVIDGLSLVQTPARLVLEARRGAETFPLAERILMPTLLGEAAASTRTNLVFDAGAGLIERNLRPADVVFLLRLETPEGEQTLNFDQAILRYR